MPRNGRASDSAQGRTLLDLRVCGLNLGRPHYFERRKMKTIRIIILTFKYWYQGETLEDAYLYASKIVKGW